MKLFLLSDIQYKTIECDIDGVLCSEEKTFERSMARPFQDEIAILNKLYEQGNIIILHTARGWSEYRMTEEQLKKWGVKYDSLIMGKIIADIRIDDRSIKFLHELLEK